MIFLGDLACPDTKVQAFNKAVSDLDALLGETIIINLEGVIKANGSVREDKLYNHPEVITALKQKARHVIVSLANNHMYDYPEEILATKSFLEENEIGVFGLMEETGEISPYEYEDNQGKYAFFGHCWNVYSIINPNRVNSVRIVDAEHNVFRQSVAEYIQSHPDTKVICFMHWNYDLEKCPFPMHVRLAHDLIDDGVYAVIGSHPHVVQNAEIYHGKTIIYSLGNFYLPSGVFFNGLLKYPEISNQTIGVKLSDQTTEILHFETDKEIPIRFMKSSHLVFPRSDEQIDAILSQHDERSYKNYFKRNREKSLLVPVFTDYCGWGYRLKLLWAITRIKLIKTILNIIK